MHYVDKQKHRVPRAVNLTSYLFQIHTKIHLWADGMNPVYITVIIGTQYLTDWTKTKMSTITFQN